MGILYISCRFWIGMWITIFLLIIVMYDLLCYVRYITRFTEESFAGLISIIFIYESFKQLFETKDDLRLIALKKQSEMLKQMQQLDNSSNYYGNASNPSVSIEDELNPQNVGRIFYFSIILFILTFMIAYLLQEFKTSRFLPTKVCG